MGEEADSMLTHQIDVFESWNDLLRHLKIHVLQNLPYPTLRSFMYLSKECFELASEIETEAFSARLYDVRYMGRKHEIPCAGSTAEIELLYTPPEYRNIPNPKYEPYRLLFTADGFGTVIVRRVKEDNGDKHYGREARYANENCFALALWCFLQITKNLKAKEMSIQIARSNPDLECVLKQQTAPRFTCKMFRIRTEDRALATLLYPLIPIGCELQICTHLFQKPGNILIESSYFDSELIRAAPSFITEANVGITDEQLPNLRGHTLWMRAPCITSKAINELLLQWMEGKRKITDIYLDGTQKLDERELSKGSDEYIVSEDDDELRQIAAERFIHLVLEHFISVSATDQVV